jgi:hypothetical protein
MCALCYSSLLSIHPISSGMPRDSLSLIRSLLSVCLSEFRFLSARERRKCSPSLSVCKLSSSVVRHGRQTNFQFLIEQNQANSMCSTRPNSPTSHGIYTSGVATVVSVYPSACRRLFHPTMFEAIKRVLREVLLIL